MSTVVDVRRLKVKYTAIDFFTLILPSPQYNVSQQLQLI